jgi:hypothetical protein
MSRYLNGGGYIRQAAAIPERFLSESENEFRTEDLYEIEAVRRISPALKFTYMGVGAKTNS